MSKPSKIKILWLIKGLGLGGAEKLFCNALPYLDRDRFDYQVGYFLPWKDALVPELQAGGLKVTCFDLPQHWRVDGLWRLKKYLVEEQIDLLHIHLPFSGLVGRLAGKWAGTKGIVYTEHNLWPRLNPVMRRLNRATFNLNDAAIAVSQDVADSMTWPGGDIQVIDNGIDIQALANVPDERGEVLQEFKLPENAFLIGKVANLTPKKNHDNLLRAFAIFHNQVPEAKLLLVGQYGDRLEILKYLAKELQITDHVIFTGPREDVPRLVKALDLFTMSSDFEGLPISMLEAMALAKPIVATAVGGIPGVVREGIDGCLVPPRNPEALAEQFLALYSNPAKRIVMGQNAKQRVAEQYDIARMVKRVEALYLDVLGESQ
jgi:glycosyltransferase involved in cell wall biosynthesis